MKNRFVVMAVFLVMTGIIMSFSFLHPYHVAVTTFTYLPKLKQANMEIKVFYHDLEPAINKFSSVDIDIKNHGNKVQRDSLVEAYIGKKCTVYTGEELLKMELTGISFKDEYIFVKYVLKNFVPGKMKIINTLCYEIEKSQTNLFYFKSGEKKQARKIVNPDSIVEWEF